MPWAEMSGSEQYMNEFDFTVEIVRLGAAELGAASHPIVRRCQTTERKKGEKNPTKKKIRGEKNLDTK